MQFVTDVIQCYFEIYNSRDLKDKHMYNEISFDESYYSSRDGVVREYTLIHGDSNEYWFEIQVREPYIDENMPSGILAVAVMLVSDESQMKGDYDFHERAFIHTDDLPLFQIKWIFEL